MVMFITLLFTLKVDGPVRDLGHKVVMGVCKDIWKGYNLYFNNFSLVLVWLLTFCKMGPLV